VTRAPHLRPAAAEVGKANLMTLRTVLLTIVAMLAFAANSLLCRLALGHGLIDAASFADVRVVSGAVALGLILVARGDRTRPTANWRSVAALFVYVALFSLAYRSLGAGTGALILFGAVQLTMFVVALRNGEHFALASWGGLAAAVLGLIYLVSPGVTAPDPVSAMLMAVAGIAWGCYSLLGRRAADPLAATAGNFLYAVPLTLIVNLLFFRNVSVSPSGIGLAVASAPSLPAAATLSGTRRCVASAPCARPRCSFPCR
jgi:drug/metabolite transporter (DMT)-like permease